ncbi:AAA family ATPase [uncultured Campylobacter sp.]|mgnify:FL=1|uniref:AAA family ATPase n=1 Tax=uncultured Campylobacter sp. TaxID=218934 RepID=UPI00261323E9|nr:AAA family ATPase [uncultured Campylobacter sp.]
MFAGTLNEIANKLKNSNKKAQLIYAFNGTGKTRLSVEFKNLIESGADENSDSDQKKIIYYNAFTQDLFYWDNDIENDVEPKLKIQPNSFTSWVFQEQGLDKEVIDTFQLYVGKKLEPRFDANFSEVSFSFIDDNASEDNIKISKGEESIFIWSIFYVLIRQVINELNIAEPDNRSTHEFDDLKYIFIDDPVSSLDENNLIEIAVNLAERIKGSESDIKFIITTHNPLFYNVLHNGLNAYKFVLKNNEDRVYILEEQENDSPFAYHLYLKAEIEKAIESNQIKKYHFNFLRNILEKTSTFLGYKSWGDLLPNTPGGDSKPYETRLINISSHSKHSAEESVEPNDNDKRVLGFLIQEISSIYHFK